MENSVIIKYLNNPVLTNKIASFDFDWTLVKPKGNRKFPNDVNDWQWLYPNIPNKLENYYLQGFSIVIFTNQSKEWKHEQIIQAFTTLKIPTTIVIATKESVYKPNPLMFNLMIGDNKINREESFFVGDALGRKDDFSDSDKKFAENIGLTCFAPEHIFYESDDFIEIPDIPILNDPEIIIMMGYPGAGKSTIADYICENNKNYICIKGDEYKTSKAMINAAKKQVGNKLSIIFDATNSSKKKRNEYIEFAQKNDYKNIRCIHVKTDIEDAYQRNKTRPEERQVPRIAYSVYTKHYEEPDEKEGFVLLNV